MVFFLNLQYKNDSGGPSDYAERCETFEKSQKPVFILKESAEIVIHSVLHQTESILVTETNI
jgi:hypothetical protein